MKDRFRKPILIALVFVGVCLLVNSGIATAEDNMQAETGETSDAGLTRGETLIASLTIFALSIFVGFEVITKVPPTLHTPLMSGSNAISGITLVGAVLVAGGSNHGFAARVEIVDNTLIRNQNHIYFSSRGWSIHGDCGDPTDVVISDNYPRLLATR